MRADEIKNPHLMRRYRQFDVGSWYGTSGPDKEDTRTRRYDIIAGLAIVNHLWDDFMNEYEDIVEEGHTTLEQQIPLVRDWLSEASPLMLPWLEIAREAILMYLEAKQEAGL